MHVDKVHDLVNREPCDQCDKTFKYKGDLKRHRSTAHNSNAVIHSCSKCEKTFADAKYLRKHEKNVHTVTELNECQICQKKVKRIETHIQRVHSDEGSILLSCEHCDYQNKDPSKLRIHVQSKHEGVIYDCTLCDKKFSLKDSLRSHKKIVHEGVKHPCNMCDYEGSKAALRFHFKTKHRSIN